MNEEYSSYHVDEDSEQISLTLQSVQSDDVSSLSSFTLTETASMRSEMEDTESWITDEECSEATEDDTEKSFNYYVTIYPKSDKEIAMIEAETKKRYYTISDDSFDCEAVMESLSSVNFNPADVSSSESFTLNDENTEE
ncbi:putative pectinesterase/pectinesterase inhibitor [Trichinella spiralis]|uniref:Pectinesterase/pectinesterase inhibitor n=1 Tax=Trichinella spiralis TaxID=6334 RepID=A0ABR3KEM6_TRISP